MRFGIVFFPFLSFLCYCDLDALCKYLDEVLATQASICMIADTWKHRIYGWWFDCGTRKPTCAHRILFCFNTWPRRVY